MAPKKPTRRWVESGPLAPWMVRYCQWLATYPGAELTGGKDDYRSRYPTGEERAAAASKFSGRMVQRQLISLLEKRSDVREYFAKLLADATFHAKERAKTDLGRNLDLREKGLDMAMEAKDHRAIETYTRPYVEAGIGKKVDHGEQAQRVVINLIGMPQEQKKLLLSGVTEPEELDEIEWEVVEREKKAEEDDD